jgi:hypothetical protein
MPPLPEAIILILAPFAPLFSPRVWPHAQVLLLGAILAPGPCTVTATLRGFCQLSRQQGQNCVFLHAQPPVFTRHARGRRFHIPPQKASLARKLTEPAFPLQHSCSKIKDVQRSAGTIVVKFSRSTTRNRDRGLSVALKRSTYHILQYNV